MTDEAKALVEREGMQVLLPPASIDGDYLMGWLEGQSYLIENYGTDEAFDQAIAVANKVHKLQNLIVIQAREIERLNASLCETMAKDERLREEISLLKSLPDDIAETVIKLGPVEWGQTDPKDANGHGESVKNSVELTAAHFQQEGLQPMNGLYLVGEETVVCHTGTSPNSAQVARALTGAWNLMWDHARAALAGDSHDQ